MEIKAFQSTHVHGNNRIGAGVFLSLQLIIKRYGGQVLVNGGLLTTRT